MWTDSGLITVSGGKLTIFRRIALDVLRAAKPFLRPDSCDVRDDAAPVFAHTADAATMDLFAPGRRRLLAGRYGSALAQYAGIDGARGSTLANTPYSIADVVWALREEQCEHLDDLLLRRTRLGNLLADGAAAILDVLKPVVQRELAWDDKRWQQEVSRFRRIWQAHYALPA